MIAGDADLAAELERNIDRLEAACRPAGPEGVVEALAPLLAIFHMDERAGSEAFWQVYIDVLEDVPICSLNAGVKAYLGRPESDWFPRPGPLKALCSSDEQTALRRARLAMSRMARGARP